MPNPNQFSVRMPKFSVDPPKEIPKKKKKRVGTAKKIASAFEAFSKGFFGASEQGPRSINPPSVTPTVRMPRRR